MAAWIERHRLLHGVTRIGLAVSGGADSVALFHLLRPLCRERGIATTLLHLNHGLRVEAEEEARFVQTLAAEAGMPCLCRHARLANRPAGSQSLEMAAREARLDFFRQCSREAALDTIATGHQADDVAETLLLRLTRGAGATGLSGLRPRSTVQGAAPLIRPLLAVPGKAIRAWLSGRGLAWREDASNRDTAIPRNLVRHTLLPQLEKIWPPGLRARLCRSADILREDDALLDELAHQRLAALAQSGTRTPPPAGDRHGDVPAGRGARVPDCLPTEFLLAHPPALQRRILRLWLFSQRQPRAAGLAHVQALLDRCHAHGGWQVTLPGGTFAHVREGRLAIHVPAAVPPPSPSECPLPVPTRQPIRWGGVEITAETTRGIDSLSSGIGHYPATCTLSADAISGHPLTVRARQAGDRIAPTGMAGSKKIQDIFVDAKLPGASRSTVPLVVCGGEIAWVPGYRVARRFAVPGAEAESVRITVFEQGELGGIRA